MSFRDLLTPLQALERELREARTSSEPWFDLVRRVDAALETADDGDQMQDVLAAAEATGVSHLMWKRYRRALERTEEIARDAGVPAEALLSSHFAHQEVALRIHERSADEGLEILSSSARGDLRLAELRERLSRMPDSDPTDGEAARSAVVRAKSAGRGLVDRALKDSRERLFGAGSRIHRRPRLQYMSADGYEIIARDGSVAAGVDVTDVGVRTNRDRVAESISPSLLTSTFFPEFYLACLSPRDGGAAERTAEVLGWLRADWVGVVAVRADGSLEKVRNASGPPVPDRTDRYEAAKRLFGKRPEGDGAES